jgi:hypothetical protein
MSEEPPVPLRLRDLDDETILWLDRLDSKQRESLIWCGHLTPEARSRLDQFLKLDVEKFTAGFKLVELWTKISWVLGRLGWLGKTSVWIIITVASILVALTQIIEHLAKVRS